MKAIFYHSYGLSDALKLEDVPEPSPKDDEVLIKVHATSINAADWCLLRGKPFMVRLDGGLRTPKHAILGADIAGTVEAVGAGATQFKVGDHVLGDKSDSGFGGFAEYVCASEEILAHKPETISFEQAAALPLAAVTALQGLRDKGKIQAGQKVLIHGASGGVGTFAIQLAKVFGTEVSATCSSRKMDLVGSLGADRVIDYKQTPLAEIGGTYDLIFAANGSERLATYRRALNRGGICVISGGAMSQIFGALLLGPILSMAVGKKVTSHLAKANAEDLAFIAKLVAEGKITPAIDQQFPLAELPAAMTYLGDGHVQGKVVINVGVS